MRERRSKMVLFKNFLEFVFNAAMYLNVIAMLSQPIAIWKTGNTDGVSIHTWAIFFVLQGLISMHGKLNLKSTHMFIGMAGSSLVSLATIVLYLLYQK
ncbi:MAG TPA: hypothetical protein PLB52_03970 [Candidatus Moranbacteria bacterium]|nr:hypothetical protein [Candidatus Moranbacteria bacterium]